MSQKFGTVVNCMDGRVQLPVIDYLKNNYALDYVDVISEPGPNGILAKNNDLTKINSIRERIDISLNAHHSNLIAVVGHYDCAGNPVSDEKQLQDILESVAKLKEWYPTVHILGLWVGEDWQVSSV